MTKLIITISFLFLVDIPFANAEQVYYCSDEIANGIYKDEKTGEWKKSGIKNERHTIKFNDDYSILEGFEKVSFKCFIPYLNSPKHMTKRVCYDTFNTGDIFSFDKSTLRFVWFRGSIFAYLGNGKDMNWISGGTCQKF